MRGSVSNYPCVVGRALHEALKNDVADDITRIHADVA